MHSFWYLWAWGQIKEQIELWVLKSYIGNGTWKRIYHDRRKLTNIVMILQKRFNSGTNQNLCWYKGYYILSKHWEKYNGTCAMWSKTQNYYIHIRHLKILELKTVHPEWSLGNLFISRYNKFPGYKTKLIGISGHSLCEGIYSWVPSTRFQTS